MADRTHSSRRTDAYILSVGGKKFHMKRECLGFISSYCCAVTNCSKMATEGGLSNCLTCFFFLKKRRSKYSATYLWEVPKSGHHTTRTHSPSAFCFVMTDNPTFVAEEQTD